jgi:hypothetical protein
MHAVPTIRRSLSLALAAVASLALAATAAAQSPLATWELSPYRIKLLVAVEPGSEIASGFEQELSADLAARSAAVVGGSWRLEAQPAPAELRHKMLASLGTITADGLPAAALDADKVLLVGIRPLDGGYRVQAREFDVVTRLWNSAITTQVPQSHTLPQRAFAAMLEAFAPLARIESTDGKTATLRLRAGALGRRDKNMPAVSSGSAFRPVLVKSDTRGTLTPGSGEVVAGVYLSPTSTSGPVVACRIDAGSGSAKIPEYHPHRQRLAVAVSRSSDATQLQLLSRSDPPVPLEGYDVIDGTELVGRTDRGGLVAVAAGRQALRMLTIRRGEATLARLPIVPGLEPRITLNLTASDAGLAVEAALAAAEDALIDLIAKREVLAVRIRAAAKRGDMTGGQALVSQLRAPAPADALAAQLDQVQQTIAAQEADTQPRLKAKLDSLRQTLDKFRSESPADKLEFELKAGGAAP